MALVGEAGVGKSRLVYEFVHSHHTRGWLILESALVSYGKATPYFPVIDLLKRYSHVEEHDDTRTIRAKVTGQVLTLDPALQDTIPALLALRYVAWWGTSSEPRVSPASPFSDIDASARKPYPAVSERRGQDVPPLHRQTFGNCFNEGEHTPCRR